MNLVKRVSTDSNGCLNISFIVDSNLDQIKVDLKTSDPSYDYLEQLSDSRVLLKHQSTTGGYLSIGKPVKESFKVGDEFEIDFILNNIEHNQIASFHYYLITSSGNLIDAKRIKYFEKIKFKLQNVHHPKISLIVIGYPNTSIKSKLNNKTELKTNDILLTDTIQIQVDLTDNCDIQTRLFSSETILKDSDLSKVSIFKPGENLNLEFHSALDQQLISLIGVDEAVYSLSSNTLLVKEKLNKIYKDNNLFCGKGGFTYNDVLLNSGLILFDPDYSTNHNPISSLCKGYRQNFSNTNENKGSNRVKRSNDDLLKEDAKIDYNYLKDKTILKCCLLGSKTSKLSKKQNHCNEKTKIFKKYVNDTRCIFAFNDCCNRTQVKVSNDKIVKVYPISHFLLEMTDQASAKTKEFKNDKFIHIAQDDQLERSTYVREDFRETWLFDVYPLEK